MKYLSSEPFSSPANNKNWSDHWDDTFGKQASQAETEQVETGQSEVASLGPEAERQPMRYVRNTPQTRPTVPGFYWAKCVGLLSDREFESVVKLTTPTKVFWDGENITIDDERLLAFAGPIPRPEE
jgi:hypothetical protein